LKRQIASTLFVLFFCVFVTTTVCAESNSITKKQINNTNTSIKTVSQLQSVSTVTDSYFIPNAISFPFYTNGSFSQSNNTCVPVAMSNAASYFDQLGRTGLISGSAMSQTEFTEMCGLCDWTVNGTSFINGLNGLYIYSRNRGYTVTDYAAYFQTWSNIRNNLRSNYPVFAIHSNTDGTIGHVYFVVGYKVENGNRFLYTYTGESFQPVAWVNFNDITMYDRVWIN
jgi:hypothetical protein